MILQEVKVSACYESETNPRGTDFGGKQFDELVASIKEKGILTPVLVRPRPVKGKEFEIVAGNRRFRAAQQLKLETIPAQVQAMTDDEAAEAQIVENLQRADIHPLEEGEAYRRLIEDKGYDVKGVAVRVCKSETYVRNRLFLSNLAPAAAKKYRNGDFTEAHAVLIAKLTPDEQKAAVAYMGERYETPDVDDLKAWITEKFYQPLKFQPWITDAAIAKIVGPCKSCPPNRPSLFGDIKTGQCTDLRCWENKMAAYLKWRLDENKGLVMVAKTYGTPSMKGAIGKSNYTGLGTKKKDHCEFAEPGIVVEGPDIGTTIWICRDEDCRKHHPHHSNSGYATSPEEKEKRKKEQQRDEAKRLKFDMAVETALKKVAWPLSEKHLDALLDIALGNMGTNSLMPICKRHNLKADKNKDGRDCWAPLRKLAEENGKDGKLRMIFELHLPTYNPWNDGEAMKESMAKL
jgi:ParB family chromosome partitioning protein